MSISFQFSARHLHCVASAELCGTELFTAHFSAFVQTNAQRVIAILGWVGTTHLVSHWTLLCSLTGASIFITWFRKLRIVRGLAKQTFPAFFRGHSLHKMFQSHHNCEDGKWKIMAHTDQYHANLQKVASLSDATHHTSAEQNVAHNFTLELN